MRLNSKAILIVAAIAALGTSANSLANHHLTGCNGSALPKLWIGKHHISLSQTKMICIRQGDRIRIKVKFINGLPDAIKNDIANHLGADEKANSNIDIIEGQHVYDATNEVYEIKVDPNVNVGDEGAFWIKVDGVGTLDPRVKIIPNLAYSLNQFDVLNEVLGEELGMSLEEAVQFYREFNGGKSE